MTDEPMGCLFLWPPPRGSLAQWLLALGAVAVLRAGFYLLFSAMGY